jgi:hypothetical protein
MNNKTTGEQFELFIRKCKKYLIQFNLLNWEVHYEHKELKYDRGRIWFDSVGGICTITLSTDWGDNEITDKEVIRVAYHEVWELFLGKLRDMVSQRFNVDEDNLAEEIHVIIRVMENIEFDRG